MNYEKLLERLDGVERSIWTVNDRLENIERRLDIHSDMHRAEHDSIIALSGFAERVTDAISELAETPFGPRENHPVPGIIYNMEERRVESINGRCAVCNNQEGGCEFCPKVDA